MKISGDKRRTIPMDSCSMLRSYPGCHAWRLEDIPMYKSLGINPGQSPWTIGGQTLWTLYILLPSIEIGKDPQGHIYEEKSWTIPLCKSLGTNEGQSLIINPRQSPRTIGGQSLWTSYVAALHRDKKRSPLQNFWGATLPGNPQDILMK